MALFDKQITPITPPDKTPETAMEIYEKLKEHNGSISAVFSGGYGYPMRWIKYVYNASKQLENDIIAFIIANPDCTTGDVVNSLSDPWLTVATVGTDIIHYNPTYDITRNFNQFKAYILG